MEALSKHVVYDCSRAQCSICRSEFDMGPDFGSGVQTRAHAEVCTKPEVASGPDYQECTLISLPFFVSALEHEVASNRRDGGARSFALATEPAGDRRRPIQTRESVLRRTRHDEVLVNMEDSIVHPGPLRVLQRQRDSARSVSNPSSKRPRIRALWLDGNDEDGSFAPLREALAHG